MIKNNSEEYNDKLIKILSQNSYMEPLLNKPWFEVTLKNAKKEVEKNNSNNPNISASLKNEALQIVKGISSLLPSIQHNEIPLIQKDPKILGK